MLDVSDVSPACHLPWFVGINVLEAMHRGSLAKGARCPPKATAQQATSDIVDMAVQVIHRTQARSAKGPTAMTFVELTEHRVGI